MLKSVLLHLESLEQADSVIRLGVEIARQADARLRGLTLLDTRRTDAAVHGEAAGYAVMQHTRDARAARRQERVRHELSQACLAARLNFDIRRVAGDPMEVLSREACFHDLVITSLQSDFDSGGLSTRDIGHLLWRRVQPLLVVLPPRRQLDRVLFVYDGSEAACRAIRSFLSLEILVDADHRLLAMNEDERQAISGLREMADYCLARRPNCETGYLCGKPRRLLLPYLQKWQADLVVVGLPRPRSFLPGLFLRPALDVLHHRACSLYAAI
jgi:nucleotide-binding universal stress UspA family protein